MNLATRIFWLNERATRAEAQAELQTHQAGQRTENLQQEKVGVHGALDECQIPRGYDDGKPASSRTRILWLNQRAEAQAEGLRRQLAKCNEEHNQLVDRTDDAMSQIHKYDKHLAENLIQYAVEDVLERLVEAEQRATRAKALAALVTPQLAELLERLGTRWDLVLATRTINDRTTACELAVRIREILDDSQA